MRFINKKSYYRHFLPLKVMKIKHFSVIPFSHNGGKCLQYILFGIKRPLLLLTFKKLYGLIKNTVQTVIQGCTNAV